MANAKIKNRMNLEKTCNNLKNQFDIEEPSLGHFDRFEARLKGKKKKKFKYKYFAIAASFVLLVGIAFTAFQSSSKGVELADISPKMEETQDYFAAVIHEELEKVNKEKTPENAKIIDDALVQLDLLETNYKKLTFELKETNNSKEIIFAMINNYQQRITVLQNLLNNLDNYKQLKNKEYENTTI